MRTAVNIRLVTVVPAKRRFGDPKKYDKLYFKKNHFLRYTTREVKVKVAVTAAAASHNTARTTVQLGPLLFSLPWLLRACVLIRVMLGESV